MSSRRIATDRWVLLSGAVAALVVARALILYAGLDRVAFAIVLLIGATLVAGVVELFRRAKLVAAMQRELDAIAAPAGRADLDASIDRAAPELAGLLRARLSGAATAGVGALISSYLLGLLVMLGLFGTFLGLFETLRGAREALTSSTDVAALRIGLAAPMQGLSRAFGTSAAGVASSALLGLALSAVRASESQLFRSIGARVAGPWARFTTQGRTLAALEAIADRSEALPTATAAMATLAERIERLADRVETEASKGRAEGAASLAQTATSVRDDLRALGDRIGKELATSTRDALRSSIDGSITPEIKSIVTSIGASTEDHFARWSTTAQSEVTRLAREVGAVESAALERAAASLIERLSVAERATEATARAATSSIETATRTAASTIEALSKSIDAQTKSAIAAHAAESEAQIRRATAQLDAMHAATSKIADADAARVAQVAETLANHATVTSTSIGRQLSEAITAMLARAEDAPRAAAALVEEAGERLRSRAPLDERRDARLDAIVEQLGSVAVALEAFGKAVTDRTSTVAMSLADRVSTHEITAGKRIDDLVEKTATFLESHATQLADRVNANELTAGDRLDGLVEKTASLFESHAAHLSERVSSNETTAGKRLDDLVEKTATLLESHAAQLADRVSTNERTTEKRLDDLVERTATLLESHATQLADRLTSATTDQLAIVEQAAAVASGGGVELHALAELFSGSIERHREATDRWLSGLGALRAAADRGAQNDAQDLLAAYVEQTRELFDQTLQLQKQLFSELRHSTRPQPTALPQVARVDEA